MISLPGKAFSTAEEHPKKKMYAYGVIYLYDPKEQKANKYPLPGFVISDPAFESGILPGMCRNCQQAYKTPFILYTFPGSDSNKNGFAVYIFKTGKANQNL